MVDNQVHDARLVSVSLSGQVQDVGRQRQIAARDAGFNGSYGEASALRAMPNVAMVAQRASNAQLCLTNSAMMWFEVGT